MIIFKPLHRKFRKAVLAGTAQAGMVSFFRQHIMAFQAPIVIPILYALAIILTGCTPVPRPDSGGMLPLQLMVIAPSARTVAVTGSFNRWDATSDLLSGPDRSDRWTISLSLPPGRYEYLFVINGTEWTPDPLAPSVDDGFGGLNSVLLVP